MALDAPLATFILTPEQRDELNRAGILRLAGLLSTEGVRRAREVVLRRLERLGLWQAAAWHLDALSRPQWPDTGLKTSQVIGNRHPELAALVEEPALAAAVDSLLEGRPYERPRPNRRPQALFTLPNAEKWTVPSGWHSGRPRLASGQSPGVQLFAPLDVVEARGGGTLAIAISHHLLNEGRPMRPSKFGGLLRAEPFSPTSWQRWLTRKVCRPCGPASSDMRRRQCTIADRGDDGRSGRRVADGLARAACGQPQRGRAAARDAHFSLRALGPTARSGVADAFGWR